MKRLLLLYITFLFLTGCETTQDVDFPDIKPKLVVNCLFNPDSVFLVHISHNASIVDYDINTYNRKHSDFYPVLQGHFVPANSDGYK